MMIKQEKCSQLVHIPHLFHPVGVLLSSALADVHLCCVDTAWLWGGGGRVLRFLVQMVFIQD